MITKTKKGHGLGWKPQLKDHRDYRYEDHVRLMMAEALQPTDLTNLVSTVKNQGQLGACVAHGTTSGFEACQMKAKLAPVLGCRLLVYRDARIIGGDFPGDNGCNIRDGIHATVQDGVAPETDWAYNISQFDDTPPAKAVADAVKSETVSYYLLDGSSTTQMIANIDNCLCVTGLPVVYGMPVYQQYEDVGSDGIIEMPSGASIGGHCNALCGVTGFTASDYYITLNSWGQGWGKGYGKFSGGFGLIPRPYIQNYASDSWVIATESQINPTPPPVTHVTANSSPMLMASGDRFVTGSDKAVWQQHAAAWKSLGGVVLGAPASCTDGTNVDVFAVGSNGAIWWKRNANAWVSLGGTALVGSVPSAAYVNGVLTVDVEGTNHTIYEKKYVSGVWTTAWAAVALNLN